MNIPLHVVGGLLTAVSGLGSSGETPEEVRLPTVEEPGSEDPNSGGLFTLTLAEDVTVKVGGRLFYDWGWFSGDEASFNTDSTGTTPELEDGNEFRAARLFAEGTLFEKVAYKAEFDFTDGSDSPDFKDVFMAVKETPVGEVKAGHYKEYFGLEQLTSSRFITFMERGLPSAFAPDRNNGAGFSNHNESKTMTWGAGVFRTTGDIPVGLGDGDYAYTARVTGTPWYEDDGEDLLHLGAAASFRLDDMVQFRSRPEANLVNRPADTGVIEAEDTLLLGGEAAWVGGPLSAQAEYMVADVSASGASQDGDFSSYYAFISWFVTGEHRAYKTSTATFDRVKPAENFLAGGPGAVELAARYSFLDLDDGAAYSDELTDVTLGVNWYWNPNTRIMLNAIHSELESSGGVDDDCDILMVRFQVDF
jgi:phosphate-selective porin OprO/OprP